MSRDSAMIPSQRATLVVCRRRLAGSAFLCTVPKLDQARSLVIPLNITADTTSELHHWVSIHTRYLYVQYLPTHLFLT